MVKKNKYLNDIIAELEGSETVLQIRPSQDFVDGSMIYTLKNNDDFYLVSNKEIIRQEDVTKYKMKNIEAQTVCNFRTQSAVEYLKGLRINSVDVFNNISNHLKRYIVFEDARLYSILTLWIMGTYISHFQILSLHLVEC